MAGLNKNKVGLALGCFGALLHIVWSFFVAVTPSGVQSFYNWILALHHLSVPIQIMPFRLMNAVLLVIVVFILWYILGWVFASVWNWQMKK